MTLPAPWRKLPRTSLGELWLLLLAGALWCPCRAGMFPLQGMALALVAGSVYNCFRGRRPRVRLWPLLAVILSVTWAAAWMADLRMMGQLRVPPWSVAGLWGWGLVSLGLWWWACAARSGAFFAALFWGTALLFAAFPEGGVLHGFILLPPATVAAPLVLRRDGWCRAAGWALVGLTLAVPWLRGQLWWTAGALGVWLLLQPIYALIVEGFRRGDCRADVVRAYAVGPTGAETAMVLLHGFADTPEAWRREAEALAARGFRVVVPHLSHEATEAEWLAEAAAAVRTARTHHRRVVLWGHSMGGAVALAVAERARPDALVLWAPFLAPRLGRWPVAALYALHRALFLWPHTLTWFPAERQGRGTPATRYRVRRVIPTRTFAAMLRMQHLACAARPQCPTWVLLSHRDTVVDNRATRRALPAAIFLTAADPRTGHALTNASDWEANLEASLGAMAGGGLLGACLCVSPENLREIGLGPQAV